MTSLLLIFFSMCAKDVLSAGYTRLLVNQRPWLAGHADGATDILSFGFVGVNIYNHPHRTQGWTVLAFAVLYVASVIGTRLGYEAEKRLGVTHGQH